VSPLPGLSAARKRAFWLRISEDSTSMAISPWCDANQLLRSNNRQTIAWRRTATEYVMFVPVIVFSGGTRPVGLSANAVTAMAEISISIAGSRSKSVTLLFLAPLHFAFTPSLMSGASDFRSPAATVSIWRMARRWFRPAILSTSSSEYPRRRSSAKR